jgi:hypothetical protein
MASYFKPSQNKNANQQLGSTPGVGSAGSSVNIKAGGVTPGNYVNFENYLKGNKDQAEGLAECFSFRQKLKKVIKGR